MPDFVWHGGTVVPSLDLPPIQGMVTDSGGPEISAGYNVQGDQLNMAVFSSTL